MSKLDLLLVNPNSRMKVYQSLGKKLAAIEPPVWAGLIATFVRKRGYSVEVLDAEAEGISDEETARRVAEAAPVLVAVIVYGHQPSASTQNMPAAGSVCREVKRIAPWAKTILVGGHVAALPERTLREEEADFVSGGEGLYTIVELLQAIKARESDFGKVRGLWYREGKEIRSAPPAPLVVNLDDEMPELAWDLLPMKLYRAHNWHCFGQLKREPYAALYTTLGCPYHCTFCCIQAPFKSGERVLGYREQVNSYRFWGPESVVAQIDTMVNKYGVRNIKIADEMFVLTPRHVNAICDLLIQRGYDLNIWAYARVDTVRDRMIDKLRRAGFTWLAFGIESASEHVRDDIQKGFEQEQVFNTIKSVRAAGINVIGNYIFGLPEDDLQSMQATLDLASELNCEFANFYSTMAYPGSPLYQIALREKWPLPEKWSGYSQHSVDTLPLPTKYVPAGEVLQFSDRAFEIYFTSPRYLSMVERKFGVEIITQIQEMTSYKLQRKYAVP